MSAPRTSISRDSTIVKMQLPKSILLKDYLLDDLSSCSSNGFRSYPRRQCCTKVRYLIEIDLNKHIKLPQPHNQFFNCVKSKPKSKTRSKLRITRSGSSVLHRASKAVVNVFKSFQFSGKRKKTDRRRSEYGFWKRTIGRKENEFERLNESVKRKEKVVPRVLKGSGGDDGVAAAEMKNSASNYSNSSASLDSYFTATSDSSTTGGSFIINVVQNDVVEGELLATGKANVATGEKAIATAASTAVNANGNEKIKLRSDEKDQFSPISVMDFVCDNDNDDDEVTSPFQHVKGSKRKLMPNAHRTKSIAQLKPVRLEDRISLLDTRTQREGVIEDFNNKIEKQATALLQLLKATMLSHDQLESTMTESVLLGYFTERLTEENVSNYIILQEAKDWVNGQTKEMLDYENSKLTYIRDMDKGVKWLKYDDEVEKEEIGLELEYEVFTSLVEEMLLDFYL